MNESAPVRGNSIYSSLKNSLAGLFDLHNKTRLIQVAIIAVVLVPIAFAGYYGYRSAEREMTETVLAKRDSISYLVATVLMEKFDRLIDVGVSLSTRVRFIELVERGQWTEAIKIMNRVPATLPYVERVFLTDSNGLLMADTPALAGARGTDFSDREWYQGVIRTGAPVISNIYKSAAPSQINVVAVAVPMKNQAQKLLGVWVMQVKLDTFFEWFKHAPPDSSWYVYIVDRHEQIGFRSSITVRRKPADIPRQAVQQALQNRRGVEVVYSPVEKEERVSAYAPVARYGWGVVLDESASIAFMARDSQLNRFAVVYGLMLVMGGFAIYLLLRARRQAQMKIELEKLVAERTVELQASNKELESFCYSISHDLRAPLRSIDGFSRILLDDCKDKLDAPQAEHLDRIRAAAKRMGHLIDDLLKLSRVTRVEINRRDAVDLSALAKSIVDELRKTQPERQITVDIQPALAVEGDPSLLHLMFENLLGNAWKFTGKTNNACIEFAAEVDASNQLVYRVRDNGAGFDMTYADKLYGAFQRLHSADEFPGTGIGLATVQRIVRRLGGQVWAESAVGKGATFYFTLPETGSVTRQSEHALAVDD